MAALARDNVDSPAVVIGGVDDHVQALVRLSCKVPVMTVVLQCAVTARFP